MSQIPTNFPYGITTPLVTGGGALSYHGGNNYFVGGTSAGASGNPGTEPNHAVATIAQALDLCTANNGDVVHVLPGYTQAVSAAAGLAFDVAGVTVIGYGTGTSRPTITLDTADTADIDIDAANVTLGGLIFSANFADIAAAIDVNADDFTAINCRFQETAADMNAKIWIQDAAGTASDRIRIINCEALALDAANTHFINFAGTPDGCWVRGNTLVGDWGTMAIGGAGVVTNCVVTDNVVYNAASDNDSCINFAATATGICMRNLCCGAAAQANGVTATAMAVAENYYGVISEDLSAILEPIAT